MSSSLTYATSRCPRVKQSGAFSPIVRSGYSDTWRKASTSAPTSTNAPKWVTRVTSPHTCMSSSKLPSSNTSTSRPCARSGISVGTVTGKQLRPRLPFSAAADLAWLMTGWSLHFSSFGNAATASSWDRLGPPSHWTCLTHTFTTSPGVSTSAGWCVNSSRSAFTCTKPSISAPMSTHAPYPTSLTTVPSNHCPTESADKLRLGSPPSCHGRGLLSTFSVPRSLTFSSPRCFLSIC
mmetsp:Transcript_37931/g.74992  ORF Transcript_37931/g.74992 Transcript_37931/m.74992 type:complete len:236 (+) Transcript_37931:337-1044(+)